MVDDADLEATIESAESSPGGRAVGGALEVSVVVLSGDARGTRLPIRGRLTVGKSNDNDLVLSEESVSRVHCEISRVGRGVRVRDLGSTNGTYVERVRITEAVTPVGSVIRVGNAVELALRPDLTLLEVEPFAKGEIDGVIGAGLAMRRIFAVLDGVARTDATVLLLGETGTGKEVLAHAIANRSHRRSPFVVVDCGAVTPTLIQSELFGHERGAFTGALAQRKGAFESARGGTIFLDEIGELPPDVQPMLLRVLEARKIRRVGGNQTIPVDVRVLAATSRDLEREVSAGRFREDLYFRLAVVPITIPPLRARRDDIPALVAQILSRIPGAALLAPGPRTLSWLLQHDWPGNVRELRNILERAAYLSLAAKSSELLLPALPSGPASTGDDAFGFTLAETFREARARVEDDFERRYVAWLLANHGGNLSAAARAVQMDRKHLHVLARKHGLRGDADE